MSWKAYGGSAILLLSGMEVLYAAQPIPVTAHAGQRCHFTQAPDNSGGVNITLDQSAIASSAISISPLLDPTTALVKQSSITLTYQALCNYKHSITVKSQKDGMKQSSIPDSAAPGFATNINYSAKVFWGNAGVTLDTTGGSVEKTATTSNITPRHGDFDVLFSIV